MMFLLKMLFQCAILYSMERQNGLNFHLLACKFNLYDLITLNVLEEFAFIH